MLREANLASSNGSPDIYGTGHLPDNTEFQHHKITDVIYKGSVQWAKTLDPKADTILQSGHNTKVGRSQDMPRPNREAIVAIDQDYVNLMDNL
ncbi:hypothetical protein CEXT_243891 [Caerostris extrusa]|uniref:Uncharacterized protein n=1 Tax=Caerostris extrusa TaxID=172846 RepID=A0AAV4RM59_CAEEX|nr:hypothetical protein CEXT_243891 [Caerostris extrusa]